ncbi:MAG: D-alanyl-D-alanine carboxypeptidase/D-alanyl-D-alanine-endopeptidase [Actinomycetota bacterium]
MIDRESSTLVGIRRIAQRAWQRVQRFDTHVVSSDPQRATVSVIVAATVLFVPVFSAWQVASTAAGEARPLTTAMSTDPAPTEPLFSVRRIARTAAIEARVANLRTSLATYAATLPAGTCLSAVADTREVVSVNATTPLVPASNMKLLTAAAALDVLGPDHRFETALVGSREGATIVGNLWLVGGGDPVLSTRAYPATQKYPTLSPTFLDALADEVAASGVTIVSGSVVGDESRYDSERYVPTWGDGIRAIEAGPLSALMVDDGILLGEPLKPSDPARGAATAFTRLLQARGVSVLGAPRSGVAPTSGVELARLTSAPLSAVMLDVLTNSDNNAAELLLKELGLARAQNPSRTAGLQVVADVLAARGVAMNGVVLADGSGLDLGNRVTCATLTSLLDVFGFDSPIGASLAVAGTTGTLRDVLMTGPGSGRVRAKTGTLRNVKSLSGFFPTNGGSITFALILNDAGVSNQSAYRPLWENLMKGLATYRASPQEAQLLPR